MQADQEQPIDYNAKLQNILYEYSRLPELPCVLEDNNDEVVATALGGIRERYNQLDKELIECVDHIESITPETFNNCIEIAINIPDNLLLKPLLMIYTKQLEDLAVPFYSHFIATVLEKCLKDRNKFDVDYATKELTLHSRNYFTSQDELENFAKNSKVFKYADFLIGMGKTDIAKKLLKFEYYRVSSQKSLRYFFFRPHISENINNVHKRKILEISVALICETNDIYWFLTGFSRTLSEKQEYGKYLKAGGYLLGFLQESTSSWFQKQKGDFLPRPYQTRA